MNIFGIGLPEMAVIAAIGLLVFGPKRLPEFGKTLGKTLKGFQSASQEFEKELRTAMSSEAAADAGAVSIPPSPAATVDPPVLPTAASDSAPAGGEPGEVLNPTEASTPPRVSPPA